MDMLVVLFDRLPGNVIDATANPGDDLIWGSSSKMSSTSISWVDIRHLVGSPDDYAYTSLAT